MFNLALAFHFEGWTFLTSETQVPTPHPSHGQLPEALRPSCPGADPSSTWEVEEAAENLRELPPPCLWLPYPVTQLFITSFTGTWGLGYPAAFLNQLLKYLHKEVELLPAADVINVAGDKV